MAAGACDKCGNDYGEYGCSRGVCRAYLNEERYYYRDEEGVLRFNSAKYSIDQANMEYYLTTMAGDTPPSK